jgi:hypothetical protein
VAEDCSWAAKPCCAIPKARIERLTTARQLAPTSRLFRLPANPVFRVPPCLEGRGSLHSAWPLTSSCCFPLLPLQTVKATPDSKMRPSASQTTDPRRNWLLGRVEVAGKPGHGLSFPVTATVDFQRQDGTLWNWTLSDQSYELVHLLSRVVRLLSGRLDTARRTRSKRRGYDGALWLDLPVNLCGQILELAEEQQREEESSLLDRRRDAESYEPPAEFFVGSLEPGSPKGAFSFGQTVATLLSGLQAFRELLKQWAGEDQLLAAHRQLTDLSLDLLICCETYFGFVHPYWIRTRRCQRSSPELAGALWEATRQGVARRSESWHCQVAPTPRTRLHPLLTCCFTPCGDA